MGDFPTEELRFARKHATSYEDDLIRMRREQRRDTNAKIKKLVDEWHDKYPNEIAYHNRDKARSDDPIVNYIHDSMSNLEIHKHYKAMVETLSSDDVMLYSEQPSLPYVSVYSTKHYRNKYDFITCLITKRKHELGKSSVNGDTLDMLLLALWGQAALIVWRIVMLLISNCYNGWTAGMLGQCVPPSSATHIGLILTLIFVSTFIVRSIMSSKYHTQTSKIKEALDEYKSSLLTTNKENKYD